MNQYKDDRLTKFCIVLLFVGFPLVSLAIPPLTPANFRHQVYSQTAAEIFWDRSTNVATQGYEITKNGEILGVFDALSYFDDTLTPGIAYTFTLTAIGTDGERSGTSALVLNTPQEADTISSLMRQLIALEDEIAELRAAVSSGAGGGVRAPVQQTGQTISAVPGDDGDYQAGIEAPGPRFTVNVDSTNDSNGNGVCDGDENCDGTVTDNLTGLIWLQDANCFGGRSWFDAIEEANLLTGDLVSNCGLSDKSKIGDWRLPNVKELQSLIDYGHDFPTPLLPDGHPFTNVQIGGTGGVAPYKYWTSTSTGSGNTGFYTVSIAVGWVERIAASNTSVSFVWPVRGGGY